MAALVQTYPQQSSTVTMLQTRPSSASGILQTSSQNTPHHQYPVNPSHRNSYHGISNGAGMSNYRGAPIAPYAFTSTPNLAMPGQRVQNGPHVRQDQRTSSAPIIPTFESGQAANRSRYPAAASVSTTSSSSSEFSSLSQKSGSKNDSATPGTTHNIGNNPRPFSTIITTAAQTLTPPTAQAVKASPDRYRRPNNRRADSSNGQQTTSQLSSTGSAMPNVMQFYGSSTQQGMPIVDTTQRFNIQIPQLSKQAPNVTATTGVAADDMQFNRHNSQGQAKRYRRRSIHTIDTGDYNQDVLKSIPPGLQQQGSRQVSSANGRIDHQQHPLRSSPIVTVRQATVHGRNDSTESINSIRSSHHSRPTSRPGSVSSVNTKHPTFLLINAIQMQWMHLSLTNQTCLAC